MEPCLSRCKKLSDVVVEQSQLNKVLSTFDLIALGVGSTLGVGVYVLPGIVSKEIAGPGVVISFFYAAVASVLAGLCYAEFGARVPKAGSAYIYSYVTMGEFVAFIIGWNLIIEYIIGGASVARGVSVYLDSLFNNTMTDYFRSIYTIEVSFLSEYIDFFALTISVVACVCLAVGLKESIILNNLLTTVNCCIVVFVIVVGGYHADFTNWNLPADTIPMDFGEGGFLPYGWLGTLTGAATCFYGFVGFDIIATSGEEARNPRTAIPISIIVSLLIIFLAYSGVSSVLTLMWPYYLQDVDAPIPYVFAELDLHWAKWIVTIGGLFGLGASLFGGMFPLPRVIYAMSQDGLLFECLGRVHPKYKTPFIGTILSGIVTGVMAAVFSLKHLVDLMSMATLVCYTIVAMSVLILRYQPSDENEIATSETSPLTGSSSKRRLSVGDSAASACTTMAPLVYFLTTVCALLAIFLIIMQHIPERTMARGPFFCGVFILIIFIIMLCFLGTPYASSPATFQMPGMPFTPTISIFINLYLMFLMDLQTWIRFGIWIFAGLLIYFIYGVSHSKENKRKRPKGDYRRLS